MTQAQIKKLNEQIVFLKDRLSSLSQNNIENEEVEKLKNQLLDLKNKIVTSNKTAKDKTTVIKGYSAIHDYIEKNDLNPMFEEKDQKKLKDGTPYNIYSNETDTGYSNEMLPPKTPVSSSVTLNEEEIDIIVSSNTDQIAILTTPFQGVEELTVTKLNNTNKFTPPMAPSLEEDNTLPTVPDENSEDLVPFGD